MYIREILTIYVVIHAFIFVVTTPLYFLDEKIGFFAYMLPWQLYKKTKMNMFGCIVVSIVGLLLVPLFWTVSFIYWAFHVGRRNKEDEQEK